MAEPGPLRQLFRSAWWVVLNLVGLVLVGQWLWEVVPVSYTHLDVYKRQGINR